MNSYYYGRRDYNQSHEESAPLVIVILVTLLLIIGAYLLTTRFHVRPHQLVEFSIYFMAFVALCDGNRLAFSHAESSAARTPGPMLPSGSHAQRREPCAEGVCPESSCRGTQCSCASLGSGVMKFA